MLVLALLRLKLFLLNFTRCSIFGVPQGSCLRTLLFNIYTNYINFLPIKSDIILYADDVVLSYTHSSLNIVNAALNHDLSIIAKWCSFIKLAINTSKTKAILFTSKVVDAVPLIFVNDFPIEIISNYNYLGIKLIINLNFRNILAMSILDFLM